VRPRRLSLQGFGSFRDRVDIDFDGIDYFALVGPTGHGKSTIVDAIGFALYGMVPRYDDERAIAPVVSLGAQEARVELEFSVADDTYVAARVVKVRNGRPKQEGRLERVLPEGGTESLAGGIREMKPAVEALLGLPFGHFTKCVALPQGEFQRFLHDKPEQRRDVLVRLLNLDLYERLGKRARALATERKADGDADERQLVQYAGATAEAAKDATARHQALHALAGDVAAALPADDEIRQRFERATSDATRANDFVRLLGKVKVPAEVAELGDAYADAKRRVEVCADALHEASAVRTEAEKLAAAHEPELLGKLLEAHETLATERTALAADEKAAKKLVRDDEKAHAAVAAAHDAIDVADAALHAARVEHRAHALVGELRLGEPCPVCAQTVGTLPDVAPPADVTAAEQALDRAKRAARAADDAAKQTVKQRAGREQAIEQRLAGIRRLEALLADHPDVGAVRDALTAAKEAQQVAVAAAKREREAQQAERDARARADQLAKRVDAVERDYTAQRDPLVELQPPVKGSDVVVAWQELASWATHEIDGQREAAAGALGTAQAAKAEREELATALAERAAPFGVRAGTLTELQPAVVKAEAQAQHALERIAEQREQADALRARITATRAEQQVAAELGRLLRSDQFVEWLVVEALASLVRGASALLETISNNAYALQLGDDGEFEVVDHLNADETRSVRTLSGGETFQASLALALALADQLSSLAADGAPRLEAMFLDEGFGSLDPESLDVVASTIELLGTSGRMVGIVTHVRELAERVPVRFEVRKRGRASQVEMVTT
jgi:exonuclease SbcC